MENEKLEFESVPGLPSYDQIVTMASDLYRNMATNHAETWCHILHRLMIHTKSCVLFPLLVAATHLRWKFPYDLLDDVLLTEVDLDEAYRMGLSSHTMPLESTLTLHAIVHAVEEELGADHYDMQAVHRVRRGLQERAQLIAKGIDLEDMTLE